MSKASIPAPDLEQAITAKYRPRRLADLVGQPVLKATLTSALERGMVASGYMVPDALRDLARRDKSFTGAKGTGTLSW